MALMYEDLNKFVRKNGNVVVVAKKGAKVTLLKNISQNLFVEGFSSR